MHAAHIGLGYVALRGKKTQTL